VDLLNIANSGYPDQTLAEMYDPETGDPVADADEKGDTLALLMLRELKDTFDPEADRDAQLNEAIRAMVVARNDFEGVIDRFEAAMYDTNEKEATHDPSN
jgi:hypothetical protein